MESVTDEAIIGKFGINKPDTMKRLMLAALLLSALFATTASGQDISELIRNQAASSVTAAEVMYRDLHQNPELSLMEF